MDVDNYFFTLSFIYFVFFTKVSNIHTFMQVGTAFSITISMCVVSTLINTYYIISIPLPLHKIYDNLII